MSRLAEISHVDMTPAQRAVHDEILAGPRDRIGGPMNAWFRVPELAQLSQQLGAFCRYGTSLDPRLSELIILVVARHWTAQVEWRVHKPIALDAGLEPTIIDAIEAKETPPFVRDDPAQIVYEISTEVLRDGQASDVTYAKVHAHFGEAALVELIAVLGYYTSVAMILNVFQVPVSETDSTTPPMRD